jgi:[acyl-carrier-protein] S-malonyltransferase
MGRLASERFPIAREIFDRIDEAIGEPISGICFAGPADRLQETRWQQPAIFACSLALYYAWRAAGGEGFEITGAAGHSLGEYGALVAAGAITIEDGARLVAVRGEVMQQAADQTPGGMRAVLGLDRASTAAVCAEASRPEQGPGECVVMANDNGPDQQVISGGPAALDRAERLAKERGAKRVLPLKVAGAFHSPCMQPAAEQLAEAVERVHIEEPAFPVIGNCGAAPLTDAAAIRLELRRQVTAPVRWVESIRVLSALEPEAWADTGPGGVVAGMAERILPGLRVLRIAAEVDVEPA